MLSSKTLGPFTLGVNNRARDASLPVGAARDAVNVDLSLEGRATLRAGQQLVRAGDNVSSLWSDGDRAFFKDGTELFELLDDELGSILLDDGLVPTRALTYCPVPGRGIAYSDTQTLKRISGATVKPFGLAAPQARPTLAATATGSLPGGRYQVACSFQDALGEESGLSGLAVIDVPDNGELHVTLPVIVEAAVTSVLIYVTPQNGEQLYLAARLAITTTALSFTTVPDQGRTPVTQFMRCLPAGDLLAFYHGRVYSHLNGYLSYTAAWSSQYNPLRDFIPFAAPVTLLHPTSYGMYIVADQTYLLKGEPADGQLSVVGPTRAVAGTLALLPDSEEAMWFTEQGLAVTKPGGGLDFIQQDNVEVSGARRGASVYRELDGRKQVIASLQNPSLNVGGASAWFTATLVSGEDRDGF